MSLLDDLVIPEDLHKDRNYYEEIDAHLGYFKNHSGTTTFTVERSVAAVYKGDFYGLLNYLHIDKKYHYPIMRVNDMLCSSDYDGLKTLLIRPSETAINDVVVVYLSVEAD